MKKACVIGFPIKHSRSPVIHKYWLDKYSIEGEYIKVSVSHETIKSYLADLQANGFVGANVTIPHKLVALETADHIDAAAKAIGAANTLWVVDGALHAGNTDAYGFITHLNQSAPGWQADRPAIVLGAGGAARAVLYALKTSGVPEIRLLNRTRKKAEKLALEFGTSIKVADWDTRNEALEGCGLLVNTTALGMQNGPSLKIDLSGLSAGATVYDIVYVPLETPLLAAARARRLTPVDGLGMLLHQAVPGFERWFGVRPEVTPKLRAKVIEDINNPSC